MKLYKEDKVINADPEQTKVMIEGGWVKKPIKISKVKKPIEEPKARKSVRKSNIEKKDREAVIIN